MTSRGAVSISRLSGAPGYGSVTAVSLDSQPALPNASTAKAWVS